MNGVRLHRILGPPLVMPAPVKCNTLLSRDPAVFVQPCRLTMALIQMGAKGEVQPLDTG